MFAVGLRLGTPMVMVERVRVEHARSFPLWDRTGTDDAQLMGRLKTAAPRVGGLAPRVGLAPKLAETFYQSTAWKAMKARLARERGRRCQEPGCQTPHDRVILDHIHERKDGGADLDPSNLQWLCFTHHERKTAASRRARSRGR